MQPYGLIGFRNDRNGNVNLAPSAVKHLSKAFDHRVQRKGCPYFITQTNHPTDR